jgi:hypothetical protein
MYSYVVRLMAACSALVRVEHQWLLQSLPSVPLNIKYIGHCGY